MIDEALHYVKQGWRIFPLAERGKTPATAHGFKDATTDPEQIRRWWGRWTHANIGLACGLSGLAVVDVDPRKGGRLDSVDLPQTLRSKTGGGGWHCFFAGTAKSKSDLVPGVDLKSIGGYVVLPPSVHPSGALYQWDLDLPIAPLPGTVLTMLAPKPTLPHRTMVVAPSSEYMAAALRNTCARMAQAMTDGNRHTPVHNAAISMGTLVEAGMPEHEARAALVNQACSCGMAEREAERVVGDGMQWGMAHPRQVQEPPRMYGKIERGKPLIVGQAREDIPSITFTGLWQAEWTEQIKSAGTEMVIVALGQSGITLTNHLNANGVLAYLGKE